MSSRLETDWTPEENSPEMLSALAENAFRDLVVERGLNNDIEREQNEKGVWEIVTKVWSSDTPTLFELKRLIDEAAND